MAYDLQSSVEQSAADKVVNSVSYPFTVFERHSPYDGDKLAALGEDDEGAWEFDVAEHTALLDEVNARDNDYKASTPDPELDDLATEARGALNAIVTNAQECQEAHNAVDAHNQKHPDDKLEWDGPDAVELARIIKTASSDTLTLEGLRSGLGGWDITAVVTWIKVQLAVAPTFTLGGKKFGLTLPRVVADGTGEVWVRHPWLKCVKKKWGICYKWKLVWKWTLLLRVTLRGIKIKARAEAQLSTSGALVKAIGHFHELRLDHKYLDKIPLEKLANKLLENKPITVFDASRLIATVPVLGSNFGVEDIEIPDVPGRISVEVTIKEI